MAELPTLSRGISQSLPQARARELCSVIRDHAAEAQERAQEGRGGPGQEARPFSPSEGEGKRQGQGQAAGKEKGTQIHHREGQFEPFKRFEPPAQVENKQESSLRDWHGLIIVGTKEAATELQQQIASRRTWLHRMRRFFRF